MFRFLNNNNLIKIIVSSILFIIGLMFKNEIVSFILIIISYLIIGYEVIIHAFKNLFKGHIFDEHFLMCIATIGSFFIGEIYEAVVIMLLFQIGEYLEDLAVDKSKKSIIELMDLKNEYANKKTGKNIKKVNSETLKINDVIIVRPGEKIPVDGTVIDGKSCLNVSMLTGETTPCYVSKNSKVLSGSINLNGMLTIKVQKTYKESTAYKILKLIQNSNNVKTNTEKFITKVSKYYTPSVILIALIIFIIQFVFLNYNINACFYKTLSFLVISCPCALVISIPLCYFSGIGCASKSGILIKGSSYLEMITKINTIVFDKTGTLTKGVFRITKIVPNGIKKNELLKIAAHAECFSTHPIALSILNEYKEKIDKTIINDHTEIPGMGIQVSINDDKILIGSHKLLEKNNIKFNKINSIYNVVYVVRNNKYMGYFIIADVIKFEAKNVVNKLHMFGINNIIVLSGDQDKIVSDVCEKINIKNYYASLLPDQKLDKLSEIKNNNNYIMSVGDGINDALLLLNSDIGVSMGNIGSDASIEASDIILMHDNLADLIKVFKIARITKRTVWINIVFAITVKILIMILSTLGITGIWMSVFADVGVTLITILNSIRILKTKFSIK